MVGWGGGDYNNHNNDDYNSNHNNDYNNNNDDDNNNNNNHNNNDDNNDNKQRRQQQQQQDLSLCAVRQQSLCVCNDFLGTRALSCALCGTDAPPYRTLFGKTAVVAVCSQ